MRHVVRTSEGKIQLIVNQGRLFGWGGRLVQVPIEAVAILARQIDLLDISVEEFRAAPAWSAATTQPIPADDTIKIANQSPLISLLMADARPEPERAAFC